MSKNKQRRREMEYLRQLQIERTPNEVNLLIPITEWESYILPGIAGNCEFKLIADTKTLEKVGERMHFPHRRYKAELLAKKYTFVYIEEGEKIIVCILCKNNVIGDIKIFGDYKKELQMWASEKGLLLNNSYWGS